MSVAGRRDLPQEFMSAMPPKADQPDPTRRPKPDSLSVLVLECTERGRRLLRLDAREPDHLAPLFRFISDVFAKVGARACKQHSTA